MKTTEVIARLNKEVKTDKALDAFMHVCALRQRARGVLTLSGVYQRMKKAGFEYPSEDYVRILKLLAELGVGVVDRDAKGRVIALKEIRLSLQSLGQAVLNKEPKAISLFKKRNRYQKLPSMPNTAVAPVEITPPPAKFGAGAETGKRQGFPVSITVLINGKPVNFRVDPSLNNEEIAEVITRFRDHGWDKEL